MENILLNKLSQDYLDFIKKYIGVKHQSIALLSKNSQISYEIMKKNNDIKWDFVGLSINKSLHMQTIIDEDLFDKLDKYWLATNPNINLNIINNHHDKIWINNRLIVNPNINMNIIKKNIHINWNFNLISQNPNITWKDVKENPQIKWNYSDLSSNKNINFDIINSNKDKPWNFKWVSLNPNITIEIIKKNPQYDWNISIFSKNINVYPETVINNLEIGWCIGNLAKNSNFNWIDIKAICKYFKNKKHVELPRWAYCSNPNLSIKALKKIMFVSNNSIVINSMTNIEKVGLLENNMEKFRKKYVKKKLTMFSYLLLKNTQLDNNIIKYISDFY